jgi:hypothetical protein
MITECVSNDPHKVLHELLIHKRNDELLTIDPSWYRGLNLTSPENYAWSCLELSWIVAHETSAFRPNTTNIALAIKFYTLMNRFGAVSERNYVHPL